MVTEQPRPRRARYLLPKNAPHRAETVAALCTLLVLVHLLVAQLTAVVAVVLYAITKVARVRVSWLIAPVAVGGVWTLAVGPADAIAGLLAGPNQVLDYLGGIFGADFGRLRRLNGAFAGMTEWLPSQLPIALIAGSAEAAIALWLSWLHTDEWELPPRRPGLVAATRRLLATRAIRAGGVVTKDGVALGVDRNTGRRAEISWRELSGGLLCVGAGGSGKTTTCFQIAYAAIRRRKPLVVVDLFGDPRLAERLSAACAATDTPLYRFTAAGTGCYEPLAAGSLDAARRAELVASMVDWGGIAEQHRRTSTYYLQDLFSVIDACPSDDSRISVLDDVVHLLNPSTLQARAGHIPTYHPGREPLLERIKVSITMVNADTTALSLLTGQLAELRGSPLGRWLRSTPHAGDGAPIRGSATHRIDLDQIVTERAAVLFSLDPGTYGRPAVMIGQLVAQDLLTLTARLRASGAGADGLVWIDAAETLPAATVTDVVTRARAVGLSAVVSTSGPPREPGYGAYLIHRVSDPQVAASLSVLAGERLRPAPAAAAAGSGNSQSFGGTAPVTTAPLPASQGLAEPLYVRRPAVEQHAIQQLGTGEFVMVVSSPHPRLVKKAQAVPAGIPDTPIAARAPAPDATSPPKLKKGQHGTPPSLERGTG